MRLSNVTARRTERDDIRCTIERPLDSDGRTESNAVGRYMVLDAIVVSACSIPAVVVQSLACSDTKHTCQIVIENQLPNSEHAIAPS